MLKNLRERMNITAIFNGKLKLILVHLKVEWFEKSLLFGQML